jgi:hypothetical protein
LPEFLQFMSKSATADLDANPESRSVFFNF